MGLIRRDKAKYRHKQWIAFLVTDNGKTVPIRHFKGMVWTVFFVGSALLVLIGFLVLIYKNAVNEKTALERMVAFQVQQKAAIQKEKDYLMAQLAIAESKLKISMADIEETGRDLAADPAEALTQTVDSTADQVTVAAGVGALPQKEAGTPASKLKMEPAAVSVDNLRVCYDSNAGRVNVEFKVINTGKEKQPVAGYACTILKDGTEERDRWLIFPETQLLNGMPVQTRGMRFRIYNFRTMKFSVDCDDPNPYTYATIFVFRQETGELMIERDFEINSIPPCS
jgi:hypothetical protein